MEIYPKNQRVLKVNNTFADVDAAALISMVLQIDINAIAFKF